MAKQYITQVTSSELEAMLAAGKMYAGQGIIITRGDEGVEIKVDLVQLQQWIETVIAGGGVI